MLKVTIKQATPWSRALDAARFTVNKEMLHKEPSDTWKKSMLLAEHSPIRLVEYDIIIEDLTNESMGHLVRHHAGLEKFVATLRDDRSGIDPIKVTYLTPRKILLSCNTQALINISRKRLCNKAHRDTIIVWNAVKKEMEKVDPIMADAMVRECVYRGFCPEPASCNFDKTSVFLTNLMNYRNGRKD